MLQQVYQDASEALSSFPQALIDILLEYAGLSAKLDKAAPSPTLLLSKGLNPASDASSGIKELMDNLQALKAMMTNNEIEKKEALEGTLSKITQVLASHPKLSFDTQVTENKKLSHLLHEWFSDYEGLYGRLKDIFGHPSKPTLTPLTKVTAN